MERKYQVFVSSTYEDLVEERQEVMHALLELDCIPSGMELFPAADEDQWNLIRGVIDECDYYLVILGGRYGSLGPDGIGYTEMEYQYAVESKKPVIGFLHKDPDSLPKKKTEQTQSGQKRFQKFREFVKQKPCKFWETPQELGSVASRSLIMLQRKNPGIGWVRGDMVPDQEAVKEILELRKQIDTLKSELTSSRTVAPPGTEELAQGEDEFIISYKTSSSKNHQDFKWTPSLKTTWNEIFYHVSPLMINEASEWDLERALSEFVKNYGVTELAKTDKGKGHDFGYTRISDEDFQTIKIQLRALGLIRKSVKSRSVKDTQTYWTLTAYGDSVMNRLRAVEK